MNDKGHLANRIRELRKKLNLDAESFGRRIGRSGKSVSAWETGRNAPGVDVLENICRTYAVDIDYFFPDDIAKNDYGFDPVCAYEDELVDIYRLLDGEGKRRLLVFARGCAVSFSASKEKVS